MNTTHFKPLSKENQEICRLLTLANKLVVHSEEVKGEEAKEMLIEAKCWARNAYFKLCEAIDPVKAVDAYKSAVIPYTEIQDLLKKYPNRRVHVAIQELIGEDAYNAIKEE